jgi:hypothetical protein
MATIQENEIQINELVNPARCMSCEMSARYWVTIGSNEDYQSFYYCEDCLILEENTPLTLPPTMNSDDAIYWINRTQKIFPDQDIKIQIGE